MRGFLLLLIRKDARVGEQKTEKDVGFPTTDSNKKKIVQKYKQKLRNGSRQRMLNKNMSF
jgi:hypothetical protein